MMLWDRFINFYNISDWTQLLSGIIATLIGFGLALIGNRIYDEAKDSSERKKLNSAFMAELKLITQELNTINLDNMSISPLKMPTWESSIASNKIALLHNEKWYNDLFSCYGKLKDYNEWHNVRTNFMFNTHENERTLLFRNSITEKLRRESQVKVSENTTLKTINNLLQMIEKKNKGDNDG